MATKSENFFDDINYHNIVKNIKNIYMSDGSMSVLLDFERVLDNMDAYAYDHWRLGELVSGPKVGKYNVTCIFMWPYNKMPNPAFIKRCINRNINVKFLEKEIKVPVKVENYDDFEPGTHYPRMTEKKVWLVQITIPREHMNEIRQGTVELAGQEIDLDDLEDSYIKDLDKKQNKTGEDKSTGQQPPALPGLGGPMGMPPPAPPMGGGML